MDPAQIATLFESLTTTIKGMQQNQQKIIEKLNKQSTSQQSSSNVSTSGTLFLPNFDSFDSSKENFKQYRRRFENYRQMKNIVADKKMSRQLLINSIGAAGYKIICSITAPDDPSTVDYDELITKIEKHLCPVINPVVEQHRFFGCCQTEKQSIADFVSTLKSKISDCHFGCGCTCDCKCDEKINEVILRAQFIRGLSDTYTREQILKIKDVSFQGAVDEAVILEASKVQNNEFTKSQPISSEPVHRISRKEESKNSSNFKSNKNNHSRERKSNRNYNNRSKSRVSFRELGIDGLCVRCGRSNHTLKECRIDQKSLKCNSCQRQGHVAKVCISTLVKSRKSKPAESKQLETADISHIYDNYSIDYFKNTDLIVNTHQCTLVKHLDTDKFFVEVKIQGKAQRFEVDSGAGLTLLPVDQFKKLRLNVKLHPTTVRFRSYTSNIFEPLGVVEVPVQYGDVKSTEIMFIVPTGYDALLGRVWIRHLKINLQQVDKSPPDKLIAQVLSVDPIPSILSRFSSIFEPIVGCIPGVKCSLKLRPNAKPVFIRERPIPFALMDSVNSELDALERDSIIEKIAISDWGSPLVVIPKPDGKVRLCVDYKVAVNRQLEGAHYPIQKIDDVLNTLRNSNYFCRLDLFKAYLHVMVDDDSQKIQTISTHRGTYLMKRLSFGIKTAPSEFNRILNQILKGLEGVASYFDDIVIHGATKEICYKRLIATLERLQKHDLHLNAGKCKFFSESISFLGHVIKNNAIHKDPSKVKAIMNAPAPKDQNQLRQFLGLVTYYSRYIPNLSQRTFHLRKLLQKNRLWKWTAECEGAFIALKNEIASDRVVMPFNPELPVVVACDAGPNGIGAVLTHIVNGVERPVAFISRSLTLAESKYSQLDREALAIVFALGKFFTYLYGRKFRLITDNAPISRIFHQQNHIPPMTAARLSRYAVFMSSFDYEIQHRKGENNSNADYFSRLPDRFAQPGIEAELSQEVTDLCDQGVNQISTVSITFDSIKSATASDKELSDLASKLYNGLGSQTDYSLHDGVIFKGFRVVVPKSLQAAVLQELHYTHVGIVRMKQLARRYCWWPTIDMDIEKTVKGCAACAIVKSSPPKVPLHPWDTPKENFERIHIDYAGIFQNHYFFILVDAKSKWLEVKILKNAPSSSTTIELLKEIFSTHGFPRFMVSDNATIFKSTEFESFCRNAGIMQKFTAPGHPATNGLAERNVKTIKCRLESMSTSSMSIYEKVREIVFRYRATPLNNGQSPAEKYLGRRLRIHLDAMLPSIQAEKKVSPTSVRSLHVGERVQARWYSGNKLSWRFGTITKKLGRLHYIVKLDAGLTLKRHIDQLHSTLVASKEAEPKAKLIPSTAEKENTQEKFDLSNFDFASSPVPVTLPEARQSDVPAGPSSPYAETPVSAERPVCPAEEPIILAPDVEPRRSTREKRIPNRLKDCV